jgi:S-methylmethionine-dependent homocysteine/selenocysteine methylase
MTIGLPQLEGRTFLTDSGLETVLIFIDGIELPDFASFAAIRDAGGRTAIERYYRQHLEVAESSGTGFILESATWRSSPDWGERQGLSDEELADVNTDAVRLMAGLAQEYDISPIVVSGCLGPRGDGYRPDRLMTPEQARIYHAWQIGVLKDAGVDLITALTLTHIEEAIGIVAAAGDADLPVVISFTVETDGRLPDGTSLADAISAVDDATGGAPAYYMVNCAHPTHFDGALVGGEWQQRLRGVRANASTLSHAELDATGALDSGDPQDLAQRYASLKARLPQLVVFGGCCGTDIRHIKAIARAVSAV